MTTVRMMLILAAVAVVGVPPAQAQSRQRGFSVVLVLGDTQPGTPAERVPPAVEKALTDVKDFLPYKDYRVLESQWIAGSKTAKSRVHGLGDQEYDIDITSDELAAGPHAGMLTVAFKLQEVGAPATQGEEFARSMAAADLDKTRAELERQLANARKHAAPSDPSVQEMESKLTGTKTRLAALRARKLIDSTFEMGLGETVVVGTSKLGGSGKALIVLLTAASPKGK